MHLINSSQVCEICCRTTALQLATQNLSLPIQIRISIDTVYKTPGTTTGRGQNIFNCKYNSPPPPGKVCDVDIREFKKCTQENNYSYHKSSPCVFIKMNRIYGWVPEFINRTDNLPVKMPKQLKQRIVNETDPTEVNEEFR